MVLHHVLKRINHSLCLDMIFFICWCVFAHNSLDKNHIQPQPSRDHNLSTIRVDNIICKIHNTCMCIKTLMYYYEKIDRKIARLTHKYDCIQKKIIPLINSPWKKFQRLISNEKKQNNRQYPGYNLHCISVILLDAICSCSRNTFYSPSKAIK